MRRALRLLAGFVIVGCLVAVPAYLVLVVIEFATAPRASERFNVVVVVYVLLPVLGLGLVACVAGVLLCLTELTLPLPTPPLDRRRAALGLRMVAAAQFWGGLVAATVTYGVLIWKLSGDLTRVPRPTEVVELLLCAFSLLGLSCVGGLLWCAVRIAYAPAPPVAVPPKPASQPEAGMPERPTSS